MFVGQFIHGQRVPRKVCTDPQENITKGDSLEFIYANDNLLKHYTDTTYIIEHSSDYDNLLRAMKLITYYHDRSKGLKRISYSGREGWYNFYFDGNNLAKVKVIKKSGLINNQYYFGIQENQLSAEKLQQAHQSPEEKEYYNFLRQGRELFSKFKPDAIE